MTVSTITLRTAGPPDLDTLKPLIESAYRGESARAGWSHEAELLTGERIRRSDLAAMLANPRQRILIADGEDSAIGCVSVSAPAADGEAAYISMLAVAPGLQAGGLGRQLLTAAETCAREVFGAQVAEMTVISQREPLIAYYQRRGYVLGDERRPFPDPAITHLDMVVLTRAI